MTDRIYYFGCGEVWNQSLESYSFVFGLYMII